jgi:hypothetical protein
MASHVVRASQTITVLIARGEAKQARHAKMQISKLILVFFNTSNGTTFFPDPCRFSYRDASHNVPNVLSLSAIQRWTARHPRCLKKDRHRRDLAHEHNAQLRSQTSDALVSHTLRSS